LETASHAIAQVNSWVSEAADGERKPSVTIGLGDSRALRFRP
jgi:hypothetical protein